MSIFSKKKPQPVAPQEDWQGKYETLLRASTEKRENHLALIHEQADTIGSLEKELADRKLAQGAAIGKYEALKLTSTEQIATALATNMALGEERDTVREALEQMKQTFTSQTKMVATQEKQLEALTRSNNELEAELARLATLGKRALILLLHPGGGKQAWQDKRAQLVADLAEAGIREEV